MRNSSVSHRKLIPSRRSPRQVSVDRVLLRNTGPGKAPLQLGVTASAEAPSGDLLIVGGGDGTVQLLRTPPEPSATNPKKLKPMGAVASVRLEGGVSSIVVERALKGGGFMALVGTNASNIYRVAYDPVARK